jgi:preprotein translocase subunit SecB
MEKGDSDLKIEKMYVRHFNYAFNISDFPSDVKDMSSPSLLHHFEKIDQNTVKVELRAIFKIEDDSKYFLDVAVGGVFICQNFESSKEKLSFVRNTSVAVLYPYLRSTTLSLSCLAGMPKAILPIINTYKVFGDLSDAEKTVNK